MELLFFVFVKSLGEILYLFGSKIGFPFLSRMTTNNCISPIKDKVHEGSKSALLQKLMKFGYIVCVCLP